MVELARATVDHPKVLLLDEPTSGLDSTEAGRLGERIAAISEVHDCGVILVEHDMDFLMRQCHHVVVLDLGQVLTQGTPDDVRSDPKVRAAYLGTDGKGPIRSGVQTKEVSSPQSNYDK